MLNQTIHYGTNSDLMLPKVNHPQSLLKYVEHHSSYLDYTLDQYTSYTYMHAIECCKQGCERADNAHL